MVFPLDVRGGCGGGTVARWHGGTSLQTERADLVDLECTSDMCSTKILPVSYTKILVIALRRYCEATYYKFQIS